ncbi:hypothetical protein ONS95_011973 [Cadophora gregata]|uniref:uncharacterized protein n=1 Tax=Cadophora gregata TaxID=51156 RepID=UPI0026DB9E4A|nr:uncharacterized protein ONS95_011973 [Cadophora gregata]KAK0117641.1 hypothetical protein ONS95_011973 [Cadophora gregata]KAK0122691.1 hypothetical protein ONS96_009726 [Cadophora gregata f. sp. sojae]
MSIKKSFREKRGSRELRSPPVNQDIACRGEDLDTDVRSPSLSLDLPSYISQDKSEIEYIRRKNMDAFLGSNSDISFLDACGDEYGVPLVGIGEKLKQGRDHDHQPTPVHSSDVSTLGPAPSSLLDDATMEDYQSKLSNVLTARSVITQPMSPDESRTFMVSSTVDTASKTSEQSQSQKGVPQHLRGPRQPPSRCNL